MEKEPIKISLKTVIMIISLIVIIALVAIIGIINKQNSVEKTNTINNTVNVEKVFSENEVREALSNYLGLLGSMHGEPYGLLQELSNLTGKKIVNEEYPEAIKYKDEFILPTNITYSEFKELILEYMTEDVFNKDFSYGFIEKDGKLYCKNIGATGVEYEIINIEKDGTDLKYNGTINWYYVEESKEKITIPFEIKNNNGKCVISKIEFPKGYDEVETDEDIADTNSTDKYKEITKELSGTDVLEVTDAIKNNDGTYTLKGKVSVIDTSKEVTAEYPPRKYNGEFMKITVDGNIKCTYSIDSNDEETSTVDKVFSEKLSFGNCFNFTFENGKCASVYEVVVGH